MEIINNQRCIEVKSILDGILIATLPLYATGESMNGRSNKNEIYKHYSEMPINELLKNLSVVIENPLSGIIDGDISNSTRKLKIFEYLGRTYLCLNGNLENSLTFFS